MRPSPRVRAERRIVHVAAVVLCLVGFVAAVGAAGVSASSALVTAVVAGSGGAVLVRVVRAVLGRSWSRLAPPATSHGRSATARAQRARPTLVQAGAADARDAA